MKSILYGIGKAIIQDFADPTKIISFHDMQDLTVESSFSKEDVTGGNKTFPIASFKKDQALKVSATNATFSKDLLKYTDGADVTTGAVVLPTVLEVSIPDTGVVTLGEDAPTPIAKSVVIEGFESTESAEASVSAGKFKVDTSGKTITFDASDKGKVVNIYYEYNSGAKTVEYSVGELSMNKPFKFTYIFDIYDENSQPVSKGTLIVYKTQCSSGFSIDPKHQTPVAPKFEAEAKDAQRADKKLWSLFIDGKEVK